MYEKLVALKNWWEGDPGKYLIGVALGLSLAIIIRAGQQSRGSIAFDGMQVAGEMASASLQYIEEQYLSKQSFDDVPPEYWAHDEIQLIYSYGITVGCSYDPALYCPDRSPTRAEMAVFAARIIELIESENE